MIITVEGNIGAGKSLFLDVLCTYLSSQGFDVKHFTEPVEEWKNLRGVNLLQLYYDDPRKWAFAFQVNALMTMRSLEVEAAKYSKDGYVVVMERSSFSVQRIFNKLLEKDVLHPVEKSILECINVELPKVDFDHHLVVYLRTDPNTCMERILLRNRKEEVGKIDLKYIEALHDIHDDALTMENNVVIVDGKSFNKDFLGGSFVSVVHEMINTLKTGK